MINPENNVFQEILATYQQFDKIDLPADTQEDDTQTILPLTLSQDLKSQGIYVETALTLQIKKRALSYFHGCVLAIQARLSDAAQQKQAIQEATQVFNNYMARPEDITLETITYYGKYLVLLLKRYGLRAADLTASEKIANLERKRPKALVARSHYGEIRETPKNAMMEDKSLLAQYDFILNQETGLRKSNDYTVAHREALFAYEKKSWPMQKLFDMTVNLAVFLSHYNLKFSIFDWAIGESKKIQEAQRALATAQAPQWFKKQNLVVQDYLIKKAGDASVPALPPTLRGIPGLPNVTFHEATFGKISNFVIRHGNLTPYNIKEPAERQAAAHANGKALSHLIADKARENYRQFWSQAAREHQLMLHDQIPTADLSFMSPYPGMQKIGRFFKFIAKLPENFTTFHQRPNWFPEDNHAMKKENKEAYHQGMDKQEWMKPASINLGINGDRWYVSKTFESEQYQRQVEHTLQDFKKLEQKVLGIESANIDPFVDDCARNRYKLAQQACTALEEVNKEFNQSYFSSTFSRAKERSALINGELFASCLYALVIQGMGGTVSACCKSSKDRTGLFLLHLDAMVAYAAQNNGRLIGFTLDANDPGRREFVGIMADLYVQNIQQTMASQATYGATGLKEPAGLGTYLGSAMEPLPADLEAAINQRIPELFQKQKELAGLNKLKLA